MYSEKEKKDKKNLWIYREKMEAENQPFGAVVIFGGGLWIPLTHKRICR